MKAYCKAYPIAQLRSFDGWATTASSAVDATVEEDGYAFVCDDLTLVLDPINESGVLVGEVTPAWQRFCTDELGFAVPEDLRAMLAEVPAPAAQDA